MPADALFISYAPSREDVVLWRALGDVPNGRYVEIGANHPEGASVTRAFDERGWSGIAIAQHGGLEQEIHFLHVDAEGSAEQALAGIDLRTVRPWVLLIRSTAPDRVRQTHQAWEPDLLAAGYVFCLFDGVSRFYVAAEHADDLRAHLTYPACTLDPFVDGRLRRAEEDRDAALAQAAHWRAVAVTRWAEAMAEALERSPHGGDEADHLRGELDAIRQTLSWRVTRPLRMVRSLAPRVRNR